jgi:hypothetical protein
MTSRPLARAVPLIAALAIGACGQDNTGDTPPPGGSSLPEATFLLFPNPQVQSDGSLQTNTVAYAQAYYAAIDPTNAKDTLAKWKAANLFDTGGTQVDVVFGDVRDLGYGRRMTARQNADGTIAAIVENYMVNTVVDYTFTNLNLDAAVQRVPRWLDNINAIEFSPGPNGGPSYAKFFQFNPVTGARELTVNIDGRGDKAMPGPCISCHGGRADPLTASGLFPLPANLAAQRRGDTQARLMPLEVDTFAFSTTPGFTRTEQEGKLKTINAMVLCTYPGGGACPGLSTGTRPAAVAGEWQGTAAALIQGAYGGATLPNPAYAEPPVPAGWAGQTALYQGVVAPTCRACHLVRGIGGTGNTRPSDIDFDTFAKFQSFADRIKAHVIDRGNMPLAKIIFDDFWNTGKAESLASWLQGQGLVVRDSAGAVLRPGRPIAVPGPDRWIRQGPTTLSAAGSLFSTTYSWSIVSIPPGATAPTLTGANSAQPTFSAATDHATVPYVLQLVTGNAAGQQSAPAQLRLFVRNTLPQTTPSAIRFSDITGSFTASGCTGCHQGTGAPISFSLADYTDNLSFYTQVRGRINFTDIVASPLLRKPSGNHHSGSASPLTGFDAGLSPGDHPGRAGYDLFLNWALNGAPM